MRQALISAIAGSIAMAGLTGAAAGDALRDEALALFKPVTSTAAGEGATPEMVALGKAIYFDPRMSASGWLSCNSCHNLAIGGDDNLESSVGHDWQKGPRNAPTVLNSIFNEARYWDGEAEDLVARNKASAQVGEDLVYASDTVVEILKSMPGYVERFKAAFPGDGDPVGTRNLGKALQAFLSSLVTPAPFDDYLNGDESALTGLQKAGLELFIARGCASCHDGVNLGGSRYYPFGLIEKPGADVLDEDDSDRFAVSKTVRESYVFRASPLRNVAITAPYFHSGRVWSLKQAVAIMGTSQIGEELNDKDIEAITAFLGSLTGKAPELTYPVLPAETAATPRPNATLKQ